MPFRTFDASEGDADRDREGAKRLQRAMLVACGELGYRRVSAGDVAARAWVSEEAFKARFPSLRACFESAYEEESRLLCERILRAGAGEPDWRRGFRAALLELAAYVEDEPVASRALLVEAHAAGPKVLSCRIERIERLSHALDSARRETESRHSPPPLTALFMVSTIEAAVVSVLLRHRPDEFLRVVPELQLLVERAYFSE